MDSRAFLTASALSDAIIDHYATVGVTLPDRRLVYPGLLPAWDCEMLGVGIERIFNYAGDVAVETVQSIGAHPGWSMKAALFAVWLIRCTPTVTAQGNPPEVIDLETSAQEILADHELMTDAVIAAMRPDATLATCNGLAFVDWQTVTPSGGFAGGVLRMRVALI